MHVCSASATLRVRGCPSLAPGMWESSDKIWLFGISSITLSSICVLRHTNKTVIYVTRTYPESSLFQYNRMCSLHTSQLKRTHIIADTDRYEAWTLVLCFNVMISALMTPTVLNKTCEYWYPGKDPDPSTSEWLARYHHCGTKDTLKPGALDPERSFLFDPTLGSGKIIPFLIPPLDPERSFLFLPHIRYNPKCELSPCSGQNMNDLLISKIPGFRLPGNRTMNIPNKLWIKWINQ